MTQVIQYTEHSVCVHMIEQLSSCTPACTHLNHSMLPALPHRFKSENILNLELDMPERTTYDYEGPGVDARVQAAINAAFADDGELLFVGSVDQENVYGADNIGNMDAGGRPASAARKRPDSARRVSRSR